MVIPVSSTITKGPYFESQTPCLLFGVSPLKVTFPWTTVVDRSTSKCWIDCGGGKCADAALRQRRHGDGPVRFVELGPDGP